MPTIELTDDELAAVTAAVRLAIETDKFPRAPRLDPHVIGSTADTCLRMQNNHDLAKLRNPIAPKAAQ